MHEKTSRGSKRRLDLAKQRQRQKGKELSLLGDGSSSFSTPRRESSHAAALRNVRERLIDCLRKSPLFADFSAAELELGRLSPLSPLSPPFLAPTHLP